MESYDVLFSIFLRLPDKSLLHFQSISKSWNDIISDEQFKKTHRALNTRKLLLVQMNGGVFEFRDLEYPQIAIGKQQFPLNKFRHSTTLCSCDCLVLMKTHTNYKGFVLWNPSTNECRTFVCPYLTDYRYKVPHACGLCYDSCDAEYKVILIYKPFYAVYYVNRNYWMKKTTSKLQALHATPSPQFNQGINIEGCMFWSLDLNISDIVRDSSTIIYFDIKSDELKELHPKPHFVGGRNLSFYLTCLNGCVGLYGGHDDHYSKSLDIWIMEQDRWILFEKITCYESYFYDQYVKASVLLDCTRNNEILFQAGRELEYFAIYDLKRHQFVKLIRLYKDLKQYKVPICLESSYFPSARESNSIDKPLKIEIIKVRAS